MHRDIKELLVDEKFRKYVLNPNKKNNRYWEKWKDEHPKNAILLECAKSILTEFYQPLPAKEFQIEFMNFKKRIDIKRAKKNNTKSR